MENDNIGDLQLEIPQPEQACETLDQIIQSRRKARSLLFHILYAVDALDYDTTASEVAEKLNAAYDTDIPLDGDIVNTVTDIAARRHELDQALIPFLENWRFERIGKCTLLVLRYAIWELLYTQTPHNIIINEAIELAKCFSEKDAYKFVNGILDKISHKHQGASTASTEKMIIDEVVEDDQDFEE
jgi:transcription antitermination protein NusB